MSITVTQQIIKSTDYGSLGVITDLTPASVDVTYSVNSLTSLSDQNATATFDVQIGGLPTSKRLTFQYKYTGTGNPLDQAEEALKSYLAA